MIKKISSQLTVLTVFLFDAIYVYAQDGSITNGGTDQGSITQPRSGGLTNPLGKDSTITKLLQDILDVILVLATPIIVFFIIYAGFLYVTARGNETQVSKAHKALLFAVIGGVIILGANVLLTVIKGTIDAF